MKVNEVKERIEGIKEVVYDDETAHILEDNLYHDFVEYVAQEKGKAARIARLILTTDKIEFCRWCA